MKRIILTTLFICAISVFTMAQGLTSTINGFTDYYSISNWTLVPNSGSIDISGAPNSIEFTSGDLDNYEPDTTYIKISVLTYCTVKINWMYDTDDYDGSSWDYPVYMINGVMHKFSSFDREGDDLQSGVEYIEGLRPNDVLGLGAYTIDGVGGACTIDAISFQVETVPVGIGAVLGAFGLIGASLFARKRIKKRKAE